MLGAVCDEASEIPTAAAKISANYSEIKRRIKPFYLEHLEFEGRFKQVIKELENLSKTTQC